MLKVILVAGSRTNNFAKFLQSKSSVFDLVGSYSTIEEMVNVLDTQLASADKLLYVAQEDKETKEKTLDYYLKDLKALESNPRVTRNLSSLIEKIILVYNKDMSLKTNDIKVTMDKIVESVMSNINYIEYEVLFLEKKIDLIDIEPILAGRSVEAVHTNVYQGVYIEDLDSDFENLYIPDNSISKVEPQKVDKLEEYKHTQEIAERSNTYVITRNNLPSINIEQYSKPLNTIHFDTSDLLLDKILTIVSGYNVLSSSNWTISFALSFVESKYNCLVIDLSENNDISILLNESKVEYDSIDLKSLLKKNTHFEDNLLLLERNEINDTVSYSSIQYVLDNSVELGIDALLVHVSENKLNNILNIFRHSISEVIFSFEALRNETIKLRNLYDEILNNFTVIAFADTLYENNSIYTHIDINEIDNTLDNDINVYQLETTKPFYTDYYLCEIIRGD